MKVKKRSTRRRKRRTYRRKRRNPSVALMGNPRRRTYRRRYRRNPGFGKLNITKTLTTGIAAAGGAGIALFVSNLINNAIAGTGKTLSIPMKNFVTLGVAAVLGGMVIPKLKLGKFAEPMATGAVAISMIKIANTSLGLSNVFSLSGEDNPELDNIISNLNIRGAYDDSWNLLGRDISLLGISESDNQMLGLAETMMSGIEEDEDDY